MRPSLVFLADQECFITELSQFDDIQTGRFFCRAEFFKPDFGLSPNQLSEMFSEIGARFEMTWKFIDPSIPHRTLMLVSKFDHCLNDLLYRKQTGELNIAVTTVASNHPDLEPLARFYQAPFEVLPTGQSKLATKAAQEDRIRDLIDAHDVELVVRKLSLLGGRIYCGKSFVSPIFASKVTGGAISLTFCSSLGRMYC